MPAQNLLDGGSIASSSELRLRLPVTVPVGLAWLSLLIPGIKVVPRSHAPCLVPLLLLFIHILLELSVLYPCLSLTSTRLL